VTSLKPSSLLPLRKDHQYQLNAVWAVSHEDMDVKRHISDNSTASRMPVVKSVISITLQNGLKQLILSQVINVRMKL
jgi:hypothetical protein